MKAAILQVAESLILAMIDLYIALLSLSLSGALLLYPFSEEGGRALFHPYRLIIILKRV